MGLPNGFVFVTKFCIFLVCLFGVLCCFVFSRRVCIESLSCRSATHFQISVLVLFAFYDCVVLREYECECERERECKYECICEYEHKRQRECGCMHVCGCTCLLRSCIRVKRTILFRNHRDFLSASQHTT